VPSDRLLRATNVLHRALQRASGGRIGWRAYGMPVVELTTTGRRSGQPRTVLLTSPLQEDGAYVVVGSRGGDDTHPAWYLNLLADPAVQVAVRGRPLPMRARALAGDERAEVWTRVTERFPHYAGYQRKTEREIPLVRLEPVR
jgi:deazaflavin-dependent oxidoreductase (nitroreductase family)